jgi:hypothetical protein
VNKISSETSSVGNIMLLNYRLKMIFHAVNGIQWIGKGILACLKAPKGHSPASHKITIFRDAVTSLNSNRLDLWTKTKLHGLSPQANYTDRATAACRRSDCQLVRIEGATWCPPAVFSRFSRQEPLLFYQVAPQLYSRGWVDPVPDPLLFLW